MNPKKTLCLHLRSDFQNFKRNFLFYSYALQSSLFPIKSNHPFISMTWCTKLLPFLLSIRP